MTTMEEPLSVFARCAPNQTRYRGNSVVFVGTVFRANTLPPSPQPNSHYKASSEWTSAINKFTTTWKRGVVAQLKKAAQHLPGRIWGINEKHPDSLQAGRSVDRIPVGGEIFQTLPDRSCGPYSFLYNV